MSQQLQEQLLNERSAWRGRDVFGRDGQKIGSLEDIYLDTRSERPEWALINTGLFGTKSHFVPLHDATEADDGITVPFDKGHVKDAPSIEPDGRLTYDEEDALFRHYGLDHPTGTEGTTTTGDVGTTPDAGDFQPRGEDVSGPDTDSAMTRSEEELRVGKRDVETGRARLRKVVDTEEVTQTVPVRSERLVVDREPVTDANVDAATDGPAISDEEHEVVLHSEEPVVEKRAVPKERVRIGTEAEVRDETVSDEVRKERVDVEGDERA
jgi:uncharacterized protein (TIGR02271 family)